MRYCSAQRGHFLALCHLSDPCHRSNTQGVYFVVVFRRVLPKRCARLESILRKAVSICMYQLQFVFFSVRLPTFNYFSKTGLRTRALFLIIFCARCRSSSHSLRDRPPTQSGTNIHLSYPPQIYIRGTRPRHSQKTNWCFGTPCVNPG